MNSLDNRILQVKEQLNEINEMALKRGFSHYTRNHLLFEIGEEVVYLPEKVNWRLGFDTRIDSYDIVDRFGYDVLLTCESWKGGQILTFLGIYDLKEIKESKFFKTKYEGDIRNIPEKEYMVWMSNRTYKPFDIRLGISSKDVAGWGGKGKVYIYHYKDKLKFLNWSDSEPWKVKE